MKKAMYLPSRRRWSALKRDQDDFYDTTGSSFFIIKQGTATCIQADPHGNQQEVAQLTACFLCAFSTISSYILIRLVTILAKSRFSLANPARGRSRPRKKMAH